MFRIPEIHYQRKILRLVLVAIFTIILAALFQSCTTIPDVPPPPESPFTLTQSLKPTEAVQLSESTPTPPPTTTPQFEPPPAISEVGQFWIDPIDGAEMVGVPAGEFSMGNDSGYEWEGPEHNVYLDPYYIDVFEVSNAQYRKCVEAGVCTLPKTLTYFDDPSYADHPLVYVKWSQAKGYCKWALKRLPTEAEWEKAACGTDGRIYPWGSDIDCNLAQYKECGGQTVPVGSHPAGASPYGVMDLSGNVWEWVSDEWQEDYYLVSPYENPQGPKTKGPQDLRVFRGGSWSEPPELLRSSYRSWYESDAQYYNLGFRCVVDSSGSQ